MDQWVGQISQHITQENGDGLKNCLCILNSNTRVWKELPLFLNQTSSNQINHQLNQILNHRLDSKWVEFIIEYVGCMEALNRKDYVGAYKGLSAAYLKLITILSGETGWLLPLLCQSTYDMRVLAEIADTVSGTGQTNLRDCSEKLQKGFGSCMNDRIDISDPMSKKRGIIYLVVSAFRIYFKIGNYRSCKHMINPVERSIRNESSIINSNYISKADLVTYRFYKGRLNVFEDKYVEAQVELEYALANCHMKSTFNKRRILSYLIPVKMCHGQLPSNELLDTYNFTEFKDLCAAVRSGNLEGFNKAMQVYLDVFIKKGIYLVLEKVKTLVYRNLIKLVYRIENKASTLKLAKIEQAFDFSNEKVSLDEIECIIANLIFNGHIKGYISHKLRMLVLSKANPFPLNSFATL